MARNKKMELDVDLYTDMNEDELKEAIVKNLRRKQQAEVDLKAFREACNAVITEMDERNDLALEELARLRGEVPIVASPVASAVGDS